MPQNVQKVYMLYFEKINKIGQSIVPWMMYDKCSLFDNNIGRDDLYKSHMVPIKVNQKFSSWEWELVHIELLKLG